jgi:ABC-type phosphate/phosphonate transport system permease subunit
MDVMRAVPELVIALMLIFVLGGGPVHAYHRIEDRGVSLLR